MLGGFADYDAMVSAERAAALRNKCLNLTKTCRLSPGSASERTSQSRKLMSPVGTFETCPPILRMSVHRSRPDVAVIQSTDANDPKRTCIDLDFADCWKARLPRGA